MVIGCLILVHSFYLHRLNWNIVRICSDLCALGLLGESVVFYLICNRQGTLTDDSEKILYDLVGNAFFGALCQLTDNFITFKRFEVVSGNNVSTTHKVLSCVFVFTTIFLSWWLFYTILPFFYDMNSPQFEHIQFVLSACLNSVCYLSYDLFYIGAIIYHLRLNSKSMTIDEKSRRRFLNIGVNAIFHCCFSIIGILLWAFYYPLGILCSNIFTSCGIHFFLNFNNNFLFNFAYKSLGFADIDPDKSSKTFRPRPSNEAHYSKGSYSSIEDEAEIVDMRATSAPASTSATSATTIAATMTSIVVFPIRRLFSPTNVSIWPGTGTTTSSSSSSSSSSNKKFKEEDDMTKKNSIRQQQSVRLPFSDLCDDADADANASAEPTTTAVSTTIEMTAAEVDSRSDNF